MLRKRMFTIARAACRRPDSDQCAYVVTLLEEIVNISSGSLKSHILLANDTIYRGTDRRGLEIRLKADMEKLDNSIRKVNEYCQILDCDDLGISGAREFAERFLEEVISERQEGIRTL